MTWMLKRVFSASFTRQLLITFSIGIIGLMVISTGTLTIISSNLIEERLIDEAVQLTESFASQSTLALLYQSQESAKESIEKIRTFPDVVNAQILNMDLKPIGNTETLSGYRLVSGHLPSSVALVYESEDFWEFVAPVTISMNEEMEDSFSDDVKESELLGYVRLTMSKQVLKTLQRNILRYNLLVSLSLSLLILLSLLFIVRSVTKPIKNLAEVMRRSKEGDRKLRAEVRGAADIEEMEISFNSMMDVLEAREGALALARDQALASAKLKGEFVANISHELRTPMNGILGMLELLADHGLNSKQRDYTNTAINSAETLLQLIDEILSFAKNESGKISIEVVDFSLPAMLEEVVALLSPEAREKNIDFAYIIHDQLPFNFVGDSVRIRQVLIKLVGNALKFSRNGDVGIFISLLESVGEKIQLKFEVCDTGIGIDKAFQKHIFEAFSQADGSSIREYGGMGLGLAICNQLVNLMGGQISLESEIDHGSNFSFVLPLLKQPVALTENKNQNISQKVEKVLVIDDSDLVRKLLGQLFSDMGIDVSTFDNHIMAIAAFEESIKQNDRFHFVFVDENISFDIGREIIQKLAAIDKSKFSHFILMTNKSLNTNSRISDVSIKASLQKPIQRSDLFYCINSVLRPSKILLRKDGVQDKASHSKKISQNMKGKKILVVEDNRANQQVAIGMLEKLGCIVFVSNNGSECLDTIFKNKFDLIFMDCHMPVLDGYKTTQKIRQQESKEQHQIIIAMTANIQSGESEKCRSYGMDDYLAKPLKTYSLQSMLEKWLPVAALTISEPKPEYSSDPDSVISSEDREPVGVDAEEIVDSKVLAELYSQIGNVMYTMLDAYLEDIPIYMKSLQEAVNSKSAESFADIAHTIKGSSGNYGANRLVRSCQRLEDVGRAGILEGADILFGEVAAEVNLVQQVLTKEYGNFSTSVAQHGVEKDVLENEVRILVVDDDRGARLAMIEILRSDGYTVEEAVDGRQAILICERSTPDLILMDAVMPGLDGFSACGIIKNLPEGRDIPILIVIALNDEGSINRAFAEGAVDYISKPINFSVLRQRIARLVKAYHAERHVKELAYHDVLTGLPNRTMFNSRLQEMIHESTANNRKMAIMFIDLDRFKLVNDSLGHEAGDLLLKYFAEQVKGCLRMNDIVSRFGGDEFVILLDDIFSRNNIVSVVQKIQSRLSIPFTFMGKEIYVNPSIGITMFPEDGQDITSLLKKADMAMYKAKSANSIYEFYEGELKEQASHRLDLENDLHGALKREEFFLCYQPQEFLATGELYGAEALVRWKHPVRGLVPPTEFIDLAEDTGKIGELGEWVLREACRQMKAWTLESDRVFRVAVNLSAIQLSDPKLTSIVHNVLQDTELLPEYLELEITEGAIMENPEEVLVTLNALKEMGIKLSIDDFGTGYSSLNYLKRLPIDILKIDKSFISDITVNKTDADIVNTIISLAHILDIKVIAEGVEIEEQKEFLKENSCDIIQGYLLSKPVSAEVFQKQFLAI